MLFTSSLRGVLCACAVCAYHSTDTVASQTTRHVYIKVYVHAHATRGGDGQSTVHRAPPHTAGRFFNASFMIGVTMNVYTLPTTPQFQGRMCCQRRERQLCASTSLSQLHMFFKSRAARALPPDHGIARALRAYMYHPWRRGARPSRPSSSAVPCARVMRALTTCRVHNAHLTSCLARLRPLRPEAREQSLGRDDHRTSCGECRVDLDE